MKEININDLTINPSNLIGKRWMLITAGDKSSYNTMTASWGEMGALWGHGLNGRPTFTIFVRPSRYTDQFIDSKDYYTICFFDEEYRQDLIYLGSHSGRDENKIDKIKLHIDFVDDQPIYKEASLILICKKIYKGHIEQDGFIDKSIIDEFYKNGSNHIYNNNSFHHVYVGEIVKVLSK